MKYKRGFTLIEVLATIAIMASITVVISINFTNYLKKAEKNKLEQSKETIKQAINVYLNLDENEELRKTCQIDSCTIPLDKIVKKGLLDEDDILNFKTIKIFYQNSERQYLITE